MNKKIQVLAAAVIAAVFIVFIISCAKGDKGPAGPEGPAGAIPISFQQDLQPYAGYSGAADAFISSYFPDANYGGAGYVSIGTNYTEIFHVLIKFDITYLQPASVTVEQAYLVLQKANWFGDNAVINVQAFKAT